MFNFFCFNFSGTAVGKPSRVPYSKGGFSVTGLPEGVPFRKPSGYGTKQLKKIMEAGKDQIKFHLNLQPEKQGVTDISADIGQLDQPNETDVQNISSVLLQVLSKIVGAEVAENALKDHTFLIEEHHLEIVNFSLTHEDTLLLLGHGRPYFDDDAWVALGDNLKVFLSHDNDKGVVVPCFNESDEPYWLFYTTDKLSCLSRITPNKRFTGYWLDKTSNGYILLHDNLCIVKGKNIIKCDNGIPCM